MLTNRRLVTPLLTLISAIALTGCPKQVPSTSHPGVAHDDLAQVVIHAPPPGDEADFLREVKVFIEIDRDNRLSVIADPDDPNVVCGMPRVFYPPGGQGPATARPRYPARQVRWVARCDNRLDNCLKPGERIVIRAKRPDVSDKGCRVPERRACEQLESTLAAIAERQDMRLDDFMAKKKDVERAHQLTLFSAETEGTFVIFGNEGRLRRNQGSVTSGIPNRPNFSLSPDLGWHYNVELWQGDERVDCLDPPVWIEDDGPPGG